MESLPTTGGFGGCFTDAGSQYWGVCVCIQSLNMRYSETTGMDKAATLPSGLHLRILFGDRFQVSKYRIVLLEMPNASVYLCQLLPRLDNAVLVTHLSFLLIPATFSCFFFIILITFTGSFNGIIRRVKRLPDN